jgi:hypothetical protein
MKLEDARTELIGMSYCWLPHKGSAESESARVPFTFHDYSAQAFYLTCRAIEGLEKSRSTFVEGTDIITTCVILWYLSLEAFVNAILKTFCLHTGTDFSMLIGRSLGGRLSEIFRIAKIDDAPFKKAGVFQKIDEFTWVRNELMHDRSTGVPPVLKSTLFSPVPYLSNQIDVLQALLIALEVFCRLSRSFSGLNLIPSIPVEKNGSIIHLKLDYLYVELVKPFFLAVLKKHSLTTDLRLDLVCSPLGPSPLLSGSDIRILIRAESSLTGAQKPDAMVTQLGKDLFDKIKAKAPDPGSQDKFQVPDYVDH